MENPFLQLKKFNSRLKVLIVFLVLGIFGTYMVTLDYLEQKHDQYIQSNKELSEKQRLHEQELKKVQEELKAKETELKKYTLTKQVISDFIKKENSQLSSQQVQSYAVKIIRESAKYGHSPYVQTALLASESSFRTNPKHAITTVYGMGGIYADVWEKSLKQNKIIKSRKDLVNPYYNIASSAYVVNYYNTKSPSIRTALAKYKGYCALGKQQANGVMALAIKLKQKEKEYRA